MSNGIKGQSRETKQDNLQGAQGETNGDQYSNGEQQPISAPADTPPPTTLEIMQTCQRWLLWKEEPNPNPKGKPLKVPYYINGKRRGKTDTDNDLQQLASYSDAQQILSQGGYSGLAFALGSDGSADCWQGIDLDNIERNHLPDLANNAPGYVELSPSRLGIHAIGYGRGFNSLGSNGTGVEAYSHGRFFTFTGDAIRNGELVCLAEYVEQRATLIHKASLPNTSLPVPTLHVEPRVINELRSALVSMRSDDRDLWVKIGMALAELGNVGRGLWLDWSATSDKYNPADASKTWDGLKPDSIGYKTVFSIAQRHGWVNPKSNEAQLPNAVPNSTFEINLDEDEEVTIEYIIDPFIPNRQAIGFFGRGESGKSSAAATFCALSSNKYSTLWITSEEAESHITKRHKKLGGYPETIATFSDPAFDCYNHLEGLIRQAKSKMSKPLGIVVLDSITALVTWTKGESPNDEASVKRLVGHIDRLAQVEGVAILMIGHMNKNKGHDHIADTISGSLAWTSSTRLSYILQKVPEQDFVGFIRTAKSNLGAHFGSFYHTVPVHQMAPNIDGFRAALCGVEFDGQRIYGEQNLRMALAEDDDPMVKRMGERQEKINAAMTIALDALKDGTVKTRADLDARFNQLKVNRRLWLALDLELEAKKVQITKGERGVYCYQLGAAIPSP